MAKSLCWNCACCGDCPHRCGYKSECEYYAKSVLTRREVALISGVPARFVDGYRYTRSPLIRQVFADKGYILLFEPVGNLFVAVLKIHFAVRQKEVNENKIIIQGVNQNEQSNIGWQHIS